MLKTALTFKGISGAAVAIDAEAGQVVIEYIERGTRCERVVTFEQIESWCNENLPSMPAADAGVS
jgi:hypothetical protein